MMSTLLILGLVIFTIGSAFLSLTETALFSLPSAKIRAYHHSSDKRKNFIAHLVSHPRDLLVTILMLNIASNIMVQNISSELFGVFAGWSLRVGVPLAITLIFGEVIPKSLAIQNNVRLSPLVSPIIVFFQNIFGPSRKIIIAIAGAISRIIFFFLRKEDTISKKELQHMLRTSEKHGILLPEEMDLIEGYLALQQASVKELMTPREDIAYYDMNTPLEVLRTTFIEKEYSRIPIVDKEIDAIVGVITAREFFLNRHSITSPDRLIPFLKKPFFTPESTPAKALFLQFQEHDQSLAFAVDEYGSIVGLVSREDLFEEVIGHIADRRDSTPLYTRPTDDTIIASGKLEISEVEDIFDVTLANPNIMVTIGGWLIEQLGDIPKAGARYTSHSMLFHVLSADATRIRRIYIRKLPATKQGER